MKKKMEMRKEHKGKGRVTSPFDKRENEIKRTSVNDKKASVSPLKVTHKKRKKK